MSLLVSSGGGGLITASDITDSSASGRTVLTGTPEQGRAALEIGDGVAPSSENNVSLVTANGVTKWAAGHTPYAYIGDLRRLWDKMHRLDVNYPGDNPQLRWLCMGDSINKLVYNPSLSVVERAGSSMPWDYISALAGGRTGQIGNTFTCAAGAEPFGPGSSTGWRYDLTPFGVGAKLPANGTAICTTSGGAVTGDTFQLIYWKGPGGGTFKLQNATSYAGTYNDVAGYTSVDTADTTPGVGVITIYLGTDYTGVTAVASTDVLSVASGNAPADGTSFYYESGTGFGGLTADTTYFVVNSSGSTFKLAATLGGTAINITSDGSAGVLRQNWTSQNPPSRSWKVVGLTGTCWLLATGYWTARGRCATLIYLPGIGGWEVGATPPGGGIGAAGCSTTITNAFMAALNPDVYALQCADSSTDALQWLTIVDAALDALSPKFCTRFLVTCNPCLDSVGGPESTVPVNQAKAYLDRAITKEHNFFDLSKLLGDSHSELANFGRTGAKWDSDSIHIPAAPYEMGTALFMELFLLRNPMRGRTLRPLYNISDTASVVRRLRTSYYEGDGAFPWTAELSATSDNRDAQLLMSRAFYFKEKTGTTSYACIGSSAGDRWMNTLRLGSGSGPQFFTQNSVPTMTNLPDQSACMCTLAGAKGLYVFSATANSWTRVISTAD